MKITDDHAFSNRGFSLILLCITILIAYSNTFHASWHLDDVTNILINKNIQVQNWNTDTLSHIIRKPSVTGSGQNKSIYRPVSMVTFAFNWFLDKSNVTGYHLVNISIHCITSILLYLIIISLLKTPKVNYRYQGNEHFIALLATILWALHPIQTQSVTYIVQRMAILSALFYLSGIFMFIKARTTREKDKKILLCCLCFLSYLLAMGSKEHTITLPVALLFVEIIFFHDYAAFSREKSKKVYIFIIVLISIFFITLLIFWLGNPISFIERSYRGRPFTLSERLLTEPRVLIFYLIQLFYPIPQQFSIMHDFLLSQSLFNPLSTAMCIAIILFLILYSIFSFRRTPLISFAVMFFFLSHSVESTVIGLELVFEHRNYLPSAFLFLPIASCLKYLIDYYHKKQPLLYVVLLAFVSLIVVSLGVGTYHRNSLWVNEKTLWEDAMQKAPNKARPYQNVAMYLENTGRLKEALSLYAKALQLQDPRPELARFISLSNMGNIYKKMFQYQNAVDCLQEAVNYKGDVATLKVRYNLILCLLNIGKEDVALAHLNWLLSIQKYNCAFLSTRGFVFFKQGRFKEALSDLQLALKQNPADKNTLFVMAMTLSAEGHHSQADLYLQKALERNPNNLVIHLGRLENALKMKDQILIDKSMADILQKFQLGTILAFFNNRDKGYNYIHETLVPINDSIVKTALADYVCQTADRMR